jgi:hypothetical protein
MTTTTTSITAMMQLNDPVRYEKFLQEQRRLLLLIQQQEDAYEEVDVGRLFENVTRRCDNYAHPPSNSAKARELLSLSFDDSAQFSVPGNPSISGNQSIIKRKPRIAPRKEIILCQCCFEETTATTTTSPNTTSTFTTDRISSHLTCHNPATPHHICTTCVTRYVRSWLHGGVSAAAMDRFRSIHNSDTSGGRLPCFCSLTCNHSNGGSGSGAGTGEVCTSFLQVKDWKTILTPPEVIQVKERLYFGIRGGGVSSSSRWTTSSSSSGGGGGGGTSTQRSIPLVSTPSSYYLPSLENTAPDILPHHHPSSGCEDKAIPLQLQPPPPDLFRADSFGRTERNKSRERMERQIEEIKTEARIRSCPTCDRTFLKENGCNKMKCPTCYTNMCYCCRSVIPEQGYTHFFVQGREETSGGTCPLWTDETMDRQHEADWVKQRLFDMFQQLRQRTHYRHSHGSSSSSSSSLYVSLYVDGTKKKAESAKTTTITKRPPLYNYTKLVV